MPVGNLRACLSSTQMIRGTTVMLFGRAYSCHVSVGLNQCADHVEGSFWNAREPNPKGGPPGAWEDWVNASYSDALIPVLKYCMYLRVDISPSGNSWGRAWSQSC
jgi:hypothetical protein